MRTYDAGIGHHPVEIGLLQLLEDALPDALTCPAPKALIDRIPIAEALWRVAPRRTAACDPEHGIEEFPVIGPCWPTSPASRGSMRAYCASVIS